MGLVFQARIERALFDLLTNIIYYYTTRGTESYEDMKTSIRQKTGDFLQPQESLAYWPLKRLQILARPLNFTVQTQKLHFFSICGSAEEVQLLSRFLLTAAVTDSHVSKKTFVTILVSSKHKPKLSNTKVGVSASRVYGVDQVLKCD